MESIGEGMASFVRSWAVNDLPLALLKIKSLFRD
jgi:hypothetical protein